MATNATSFSQIARDLKALPSRISAAVARDISREIQRNFDLGVDPYGKAWRPLKRSTLDRGRHPPPLTDTRAGRESVKLAAMAGAGIRITVGKIYMVYHQMPKISALRKFPRRSFLPFDKMPESWGAIALAHLEAQGRRVIGG